MKEATVERETARTRTIKSLVDSYGHLTADGLRRVARESAKRSRRGARTAQATPAWRTGARARKIRNAIDYGTRTLVFERCAAAVETRAKKRKRKKDAGPTLLRHVPFKELDKVFDEVEAIQRAAAG
jgi:hypothetical protein